MVDLTGTDALWVVDKVKEQTTLVIPIHITGAGATSALISAIIQRDNTLDIGGSSVKINVVQTDKPMNGVLNEMDFSPGYNKQMCGDPGECVNTMGGNKAHINSDNENSIGAAAHDILHFAGIDDQYKELPRDDKGSRTSEPKPGYDKSNIMTDRSGTKLKPEQIQEAQKNWSTKQCTVEDGVTKCK